MRAQPCGLDLGETRPGMPRGRVLSHSGQNSQKAGHNGKKKFFRDTFRDLNVYSGTPSIVRD